MNQHMHSHLLGSRPVQFIAIVVVVVATLAAAVNYPGALGPLLLNGVLTTLLVRTVLTNRSSFFSFFLLAFLILGCWAKLVLHFILGTQFIEPIGAFDDSPSAWDTCLAALNIAFATLLTCQYIASRTLPGANHERAINIDSPLLRPAMWLCIVVTCAALAFNFKYAILKVGTEPGLRLNSYLYVLASFMIAWGNLILLASVGYWMVRARKLGLESLFYILILEGAVTAVSMGSRAQMILHVAAPFVVYLTHGRELVSTLRPLQWLRILLVTALLFVASILLVSADRLHSFAQARPVNSASIAQNVLLAPPLNQAAHLDLWVAATRDVNLATTAWLAPGLPVLRMATVTAQEQQSAAPQAAEVTTARWKAMLMELSKLIVDRWVGVEGVMAVTSHEHTGWPLFVSSLGERPESGTQAIYQRMSDAQYATYENFTFMTIPGPIAILLYSANYTVLIAGLALLFLAGMLAECLTKKLVGNIFTQAAVGVALAYLVVQMNFPRVQFFFLLELLGFIAGLYLARLTLNIRAPSVAIAGKACNP
ncbi:MULTISPECIES: hypothetical protein [Pseudomonas]|uniref:hypothetical protein n=1 Tax=Pseudomonas TaxID=286 RepID=UPI001597027E|nr:hypothetical protein [Pseudomonas faucium]